ncbi:MAG: 50S ribosome-binding GTPase, partial [Candidatus Diapherotrites archaeon]|nr:50S ribosome-binding GTPase [Candidatus Diapherotrites archaeon]
ITNAKPEIAEYPFTTKKISIGHIGKGEDMIQVVDTPGLFERPLEKRNDIEKEAILALKYLADGIIFIFDISERCGYSIEDQEKLYKDLKKELKVPFLLIVNKKDITEPKKLGRIKGAIIIQASDEKDQEMVLAEVRKMPLNKVSA